MRAQRPTRVLLVRAEETVDASAAREVAEHLRRGWEARGGRVVLPPPVAPEEPPPDVRTRLDAIWTTYHALRLEDARDAVRELAAEVSRTLGAGVGHDAQVELWLVTALVEEASGSSDRATAAIERALAARPDLEVDPLRYPPTLAERVAVLRDGVLTGELRVRVLPPDAELVVDGRSLGVGSRSLVLGRGHHFVRAEALHRLAAGAEVEVGPRPRELRLGVAVDPARALAALGPPGTPLGAAAREAIAVLDAAAATLEITRPNAYRLALADEATGRRAELRVDVLRPARDADRLLDQLLAEPSGDQTWPWLVGGAAAVVVAAVVTAVLLTVSTEGWHAIATR